MISEEEDLERFYLESGYCWPIAQMSGSTDLTMGEAVRGVSVGTAAGRKQTSGT